MRRLKALMRALIITPLCTILLIACSSGDEKIQTQDAVKSTNKTIVETSAPFGTSFHLPSEIYGMDREINVYVPEIPEWGKGYFENPLPVLYVVDGGLDQDFFHIAALSQLTLINAERQPMIIVGVRTHDRRPEISPKATDSRYMANGFEGWAGHMSFGVI